MVRNDLLRGTQLERDLADCPRLISDQRQDASAGAVRKCAQRFVHRLGLIVHLLIQALVCTNVNWWSYDPMSTA